MEDLAREIGQSVANTTQHLVVAYCRGPYCVYADDAVRLLLAAGRDARRLADGDPEWAAAGLPVLTGR